MQNHADPEQSDMAKPVLITRKQKMEQTPNQNTNPQPQPNADATLPPPSTGPDNGVAGSAPPPGNPAMVAIPPTDKVCYESEDQQFIVHHLVSKTAKFPPSRYPCVVLQCQPRPHTRVREIDGGYVEIMPSFKELEHLVDAMNDAAVATGKGKLYEVLQRIPEKTAAHKAKWLRFNEARVGSQNGHDKKQGCK